VTGLTSGMTYRVSWELALHVDSGGSSANGLSFGVFLDGQPFHFSEQLTAGFVGDAATFVATHSAHTVRFAAELDSRTPGTTGDTDVSYYIDNIVLRPGGKFFGPCPYTCFNHSPFQALTCDSFQLETFESASLTVTGVTISTGERIGPGGLTDSVDCDDGTIDGSGQNGGSWFFSTEVTFTFNATTLGGLPTHAGVVWTDGTGPGSFVAFDENGQPLGTNGPVALGDGGFFGTTEDDRFFGVVYNGGISAIQIINGGGVEVDHLQFGRCTGNIVDPCPTNPVVTVACSLAPLLSTNQVGTARSLTVTVTTNTAPVSGLSVTFNRSGANGSLQTNLTTAGNGQAIYSYTGQNAGTDFFLMAGAVDSSEFSCDATVVWINNNVAPQITCPGNITTNTAAGTCARSVSFMATATGTPTPVLSYKTNGVTVTSPVTFPKGITTVSATASNVAGADQCAFTVTVNDNLLPNVSCPGNITSNVAAAVTESVVHYTVDGSDNCPGVMITGNPPSGSTFPLGTTPVTVTAVDTAGNTNTCSFNVTVQADAPCVINCPSQLFTNPAPGLCGATVTFNVSSSGTCPTINVDPPSGSFFTTGTTPVTVTSNGLTVCTFPVTVTDVQPPTLTCPANITTTNPVVNYSVTVADNCAVASTNFSIASGATFPLGTNPVTVIAADAAGNTSTCTFNVVVNELPATPHDLAVVKLKAPKNINLQGAEPSLTKFASVTIQNLSDHPETITSYAGLVTLIGASLGETCPNLAIELVNGPPNKALPVVLGPKKKLNIFFNVTYNCANFPAKGVADFEFTATVNHAAMDGNADSDPANDICPRPPNPATGDKGCAKGLAVRTDVFVK
jgi:hypothetical protein